MPATRRMFESRPSFRSSLLTIFALRNCESSRPLVDFFTPLKVETSFNGDSLELFQEIANGPMAQRRDAHALAIAEQRGYQTRARPCLAGAWRPLDGQAAAIEGSHDVGLFGQVQSLDALTGATPAEARRIPHQQVGDGAPLLGSRDTDVAKMLGDPPNGFALFLAIERFPGHDGHGSRDGCERRASPQQQLTAILVDLDDLPGTLASREIRDLVFRAELVLLWRERQPMAERGRPFPEAQSLHPSRTSRQSRRRLHQIAHR